MDETHSPSRRTQRLTALLSVAVLTLTVAGTAVAASNTTASMAQSDTLYDGFEDGNADGWDLNGAEVREVSLQGQYSLFVPDTNSPQEWTALGEISNGNGTVVEGVFKMSGTSNAAIQLRAIDLATGTDGFELQLDGATDGPYTWQESGLGEAINLAQVSPDTEWYAIKFLIEDGKYKFKAWNAKRPEPEGWNTTTDRPVGLREGLEFRLFANEDYYVDSIEVTRGSGSHVLTGTVENQANETIRNASVNVTQAGSDVASDVTGLNGRYTIYLDNGTYNISASKPGYFNDSVSNFTVTADRVKNFTLTNKTALLDLDVRHYMPHGEESPYSVTVRNYANGSRREVTAESEVWSDDTSVVQVDQDEQILIATSDTSVDKQVTINARYVAPNGDIYNAEAQVTVASMTVDNLDILPPVTRFTATISDHVIMVILIATGVGVAATIIATSFAGLAAMTAIMLMGWIMGIVPNGMAMVTVLSSMFIGLNVAGNVDYQVTRR